MQLPHNIDDMPIYTLKATLQKLLQSSTPPRLIMMRLRYVSGQLVDSNILLQIIQDALVDQYGDLTGTVIAVGLNELLAEDIVIDRME